MSRDDARTIRAGRRSVRIQRPGKVLFPRRRGERREYTKGDLADYYRAVAPYLCRTCRAVR